MLSVYIVRLTLLLVCAFSPGGAVLAQTGRGAATSQRPPLPTRQVSTDASAARKDWEAKRDWLRFTTGVLGDATIKDDIKELLASGVKPETQDRYGRTAMHAAAMLGQGELVRSSYRKARTSMCVTVRGAPL